jgi:general secretion pathway protein D
MSAVRRLYQGTFFAALTLVSACQAPERGRTGLEATQSLRAPYSSNYSGPAMIGAKETTLLTPEGVPQNGPLYENSGDKVTLNLVNVPIAVAAKSIFVDILKSNFTVSDGVRGNITLQTARPTSKQALVDIFETVLHQRGYAIKKQGNTFLISAGDQMITGSISMSDGQSVTTGKQARIVPLNYISASEMASIIKPLAPQGVMSIDERRNIIVLSGSNSEISGMLESVKLFDVDWMRGMAASLFPLQSGTDPSIIVKQMQEIFYTGPDKDISTVKFLPSRELGGILVISPRRIYIDRARTLIARLDNAAGYGTSQTFVYHVQNRTAKELATVLQSAFSGGQTSTAAVTTDAATSSASSAGSLGGRVSVVADESNNSLVIAASRRDYDRMLSMLASLDKMPGQVLIEAVIAEAALNDQLKFGLHYSVGVGNYFKFTNDDNGAIPSDTAGFTYSATSPDFRVVLNALSRITDVKVVSSPNLTVLDNHTAKLQVGDQVPIISQSATSSTTGTTTTEVQMKDTGVILNVTPRISSNGHILLDIEQEVSDVISTTSSTINSPTIRQRKVSSTVEVGDGQSIVIGGLVQEQQQKGTDAIPILGKLPVIGAAFRSRNDQTKRTELMIFIRTRIIHNEAEARTIADEFRAGLSDITIQNPEVKPSNSWDILRVMQ